MAHDLTSSPSDEISTLRPIIIRKLLSPKPTEVLLLPQLINFLNLLRRQLKRKSPQIITEPLLLPTRRDRNDILVNTPPQIDLVLAHSILLRQPVHIVVQWSGLRFCGSSQGGVGGSRDAVLLVEFEQLGALQVGMEFDLVADGLYF
jgi:hypothetical protein